MLIQRTLKFSVCCPYEEEPQTDPKAREPNQWSALERDCMFVNMGRIGHTHQKIFELVRATAWLAAQACGVDHISGTRFDNLPE